MLSDPVLIYGMLIMAAIMYHYRAGATPVYAIADYVLGFFLIRLLDYIDRHRFIGTFAYIALMIGTVYTVRTMADFGSDDYIVSFGLWLITPQDALDYNAWYTAALFLLFEVFMFSVIYYFTRIRYRIFMGFLIFMIPFTIYGKEEEIMPIAFIILLSVGYILLMVYFRALRESDDVVISSKKQIAMSVTAFAFMFASMAALIPKPEIEANRTQLDNLISADRFTDRLVGMLGLFRESTTGTQFRQNNNTTPLYYVRASQPLRLKTGTFTVYNYESDTWRMANVDDTVASSADASDDYFYIYFDSGNYLLEAITALAAYDENFAEKYGLEDIAGEELDIPESENAYIYSAYAATDSIPVPQFADYISDTSYDYKVYLMETGTLICTNNHTFASDETFEFSYIPDSFFYDKGNLRIMRAISSLSDDEYEDMLDEAYDVYDEMIDEVSDDYEGFYEKHPDHEFAFSQLYSFRKAIERQTEFGEYFDDWLDYGDNEKIESLAKKITKGIDNDYDKAKALEFYFYENGYIYDTSYVKGRSENAVNFIFNTKRGVCYEYATAMVLLARAAGIPARYCEGYNMQDEYLSDKYHTNYVVTSQSAHGFPELYIKGYGWMSFEPTRTDMLGAPQEENAAKPLAQAGYVILVIGALFVLGLLMYPMVSHKLFVKRYKKQPPDRVVRAVMYRLRKLYGVGRTHTAEETAEAVRVFSGADISEETTMFERLVYGGETLTQDEAARALEIYETAYAAMKEEKKKRRKAKRGKRIKF